MIILLYFDYQTYSKTAGSGLNVYRVPVGTERIMKFGGVDLQRRYILGGSNVYKYFVLVKSVTSRDDVSHNFHVSELAIATDRWLMS